MAAAGPVTHDLLRSSIRLPRPLWLGLATVVLVVIAAGLRIGTPIYRQQMAIREIELLGGRLDTSQGGPKWLRDLVGDWWMEPFDEVLWVELDGTQTTDTTLAHLAWLKGLQELTLDNTHVTDAGLVHLKGLVGLRRLQLMDTHVTGAGLVHLKGLMRLRELWLDNTQITDGGLAHLQGMTQLERLQLESTQVTDDGLVHLRRLTGLRWLWLVNDEVTNEGIAELQQALPNLKIQI